MLYMSEHCQRWYSQYATNNYHVLVDMAAEVQLTRNTRSVYPMQCIVTFAARKPNHRLLLHFESMDINYNPGTIDRLHVFNGFQASLKSQLSPSRGLYGKYYKGVYEFSSGGIHDYQSTTSALTLYFEGSPSTTFSGFKAILTVFTEPLANGTCIDGSFKCSITGICIADSLVCNNSPNCGQNDHSDSDECAARQAGSRQNPDTGLASTSDMGLMVGCAISIVILMVVILWLGIICLKRKRYPSNQQREFFNPGTGLGPDEVEGSVVEPAQPRNFMAPVLAFFEPPPLYTETTPPVCSGIVERPRFEPPPPYSLEDHDMAGLIMNECSENRQLVPAVDTGIVQAGVPPPSLQPAAHPPLYPVHTAAPRAATELMDNAANERCQQRDTSTSETYQSRSAGDKDVTETSALTDSTSATTEGATNTASQQEALLPESHKDVSDQFELAEPHPRQQINI